MMKATTTKWALLVGSLVPLLSGCGLIDRLLSREQECSCVDRTVVSLRPDDVVILDPALNGEGRGMPLHAELFAGNTYLVSALIFGETGGATDSAFLWQGGYHDTEGAEQASRYLVVSNDQPLQYDYPTTDEGDGPLVYAFFADSTNASDNTASGQLFVEDDTGANDALEVAFDISPKHTVYLDALLDSDGNGVALDGLLEPGQTYDLSVSVTGETGGVTSSVFLWQGGYVDQHGVQRGAWYTTLSNDQFVRHTFPASSDGTGPLIYAFFADSTNTDDNTASGWLTLTRVP